MYVVVSAPEYRSQSGQNNIKQVIESVSHFEYFGTTATNQNLILEKELKRD
jgi:hypothetical protein